MSSVRQIPAVSRVLNRPELAEAVLAHGHPAVAQAVRKVLGRTREAILRGEEGGEEEALLREVQAELAYLPQLYRRVFNATGVLLHTNLGRAPLADAAWEAMASARGYCDLETNLSTGKRASRLRDIAPLLAEVTGAPAGLVVNNNAAGLLLAIATLAGSKPTAISRGHLVEIGGGFRLPTILQASGSPLMEIGTTNRTHLHDYEEALAAGAGAVLLVHRSNFVMTGYVSEPPMAEIIAASHARGVPVIFDLGSGALLPHAGLADSITVQDAVRLGFAAICFSGDKLMGGPQAGLVVGDADAVARMRKHPLQRALRCDKLQLAACAATLELYRRGLAERQIPLWRMVATDTYARAQHWREGLGQGEVVEAPGAIGGGAMPETSLPGSALALATPNPDDLLARLRDSEPPVVGHIDSGRVLLHPRTIAEADDAEFLGAVRRVLG